jgi:hypothetical protein
MACALFRTLRQRPRHERRSDKAHNRRTHASTRGSPPPLVSSQNCALVREKQQFQSLKIGHMAITIRNSRPTPRWAAGEAASLASRAGHRAARPAKGRLPAVQCFRSTPRARHLWSGTSRRGRAGDPPAPGTRTGIWIRARLPRGGQTHRPRETTARGSTAAPGTGSWIERGAGRPTPRWSPCRGRRNRSMPSTTGLPDFETRLRRTSRLTAWSPTEVRRRNECRSR